MKQIAANPEIAICGERFAGHVIGENLGCILSESNVKTMRKLREVFVARHTNGHVDESDLNTYLLRIKPTDGRITGHSTKYVDRYYDVNFASKTAV